MRKWISLLLCLGLVMGLMTGALASETKTGKATGFGGELTVEVTTDNGTITAVTIVNHNETAGIGTPALEQLPEMIVAAGSAAVDAIGRRDRIQRSGQGRRSQRPRPRGKPL